MKGREGVQEFRRKWRAGLCEEVDDEVKDVVSSISKTMNRCMDGKNEDIIKDWKLKWFVDVHANSRGYVDLLVVMEYFNLRKKLSDK